MTDEASRERSGGSGRWPRYERPEIDDVERETDPVAGAGPRRRRRDRRSRSRWMRLGVFLAAVSIWSGVSRAVGGEDAPEPLPAEQRYEPIWSPPAQEALRAAVLEATGDTEVLDFRTYGLDEATVRTPPAEAGDLADEWRWDGRALEKWSASAAGDDKPFDLDLVDPDVLVTLDQKAREMSDGRISDSRISIAAPAYDGDDWVQLHLDEVDHGAVVLFADLHGVVAGDLINESWRDD